MRTLSGIVLSTLFINLALVSNINSLSLQQPTSITTVRFFPQPQPFAVYLNEEFTVACVLEDVSDLYGLDIRIAWDPSVLTYINHTMTLPKENYSTPIPPGPYAGILWRDPGPIILVIRNEANTTAGTYWVAAASLAPAPSFNGSGTVFIMSFRAPDYSCMTQINFTRHSLGDSEGASINHVQIDYELIVGPGNWPPRILGVNHFPVSPNYDENVTVSANVTDPNLDTVLLSYTFNSTWHNISMIETSDSFRAPIVAQPYNTTVQYRIYANDTEGNWTKSAIYSYVVNDYVAPDIDAEWNPTNPPPLTPSSVPRQGEEVAVTASMLEPIGASRVIEAELRYRVNGWAWRNTTMQYNETNSLWTNIIPGHAGNSTIEFYITAQDEAGNTGTSTIYIYQVKPLMVGDVDGDGDVDIFDVVLVAQNYGQTSS